MKHSQKKEKERVMPKAGQERVVDVGPAGFLVPSAMQLGVEIPASGSGLLYGVKAPEDAVIEEAARQMLTRKNPTIFPAAHVTESVHGCTLQPIRPRANGLPKAVATHAPPV